MKRSTVSGNSGALAASGRQLTKHDRPAIQGESGEEVPQQPVARGTHERVRHLAHEQARDEGRPSINLARPLPSLPQPSQAEDFEDDDVEPDDGDEEEEEGGKHAVL